MGLGKECGEWGWEVGGMEDRVGGWEDGVVSEVEREGGGMVGGIDGWDGRGWEGRVSCGWGIILLGVERGVVGFEGE